jgi:hypothetical protein
MLGGGANLSGFDPRGIGTPSLDPRGISTPSLASAKVIRSVSPEQRREIYEELKQVCGFYHG